MLFGVLSGSCQPFFAIRRDKADGQPGFLYYIGYTALGGATLQPAQLGILSAELCQSALQIGIERVNAGLPNRTFFIFYGTGYLIPLNKQTVKMPCADPAFCSHLPCNQALSFSVRKT